MMEMAIASVGVPRLDQVNRAMRAGVMVMAIASVGVPRSRLSCNLETLGEADPGLGRR